MKQIVTILLIILQIGTYAQVTENFSDGDFSLDPQWIGDTSKFEVNTAEQLQLHSSGVDTSFLFTTNSFIENSEWNFWLKLAFNTSANNYARIYLAADHPDPRSSMNAYFLQIGGIHDSLDFYRQNGYDIEKLFTGNYTSTNHSTNTLRIKVIHDKSGKWHLLTDRTGDLNYLEEGAILDSTITSTSWFGLYCHYTSSNSIKFYFDDIYIGPVIEDTITPIHQFDILIDEIMADPDPQVDLPDAEFVELFNRADFPVRLKDWTFSFGSSWKILPDVTLLSHEFLLLTKGNMLTNYGRVLDLFTSTSSLANDGSTLVLRDNRGKVIHSVTYSTGWYQNPLKAAGGWSLEMIDPDNPCGCKDNWTASIDPSGGTPGKINSVHHQNPDTLSPELIRAVIKDSITLHVFFSEPMDSLSLLDVSKWTVDQEMGNPEKITPVSPDFKEAGLTLTGLIQRNIVYTINPGEGLNDCSGNSLKQQKSIRVAYPDSVKPNDIVINEILSNPATGGEKFIEIFNRSNKILDLNDVVLSSFNTLTNTISDPVDISVGHYLSFPGNYFVLTVNPEDIMDRYMTPGEFAFITLSDLPSLGKDEGIVVITRKTTGEIIDRVNYSKDMQFELLISTAGVSLERMNPSIPSIEKNNWHSAGSSCGYATPGYQNSQNISTGLISGIIRVTPQIFSPDNDGKNDVLVINIQPDEPGFICNLTMYDDRGRIVRQLVKNRLLSGNDHFTWDGVDDNGRKAAIGIYVLYLELLKPDGKVKRFKNAVVLGGHL
ncbi:MAG: lamin tail domain-containing protein [Bacteroidetes bacterium]|nr:lamin tail domain-containing protein [Bacteroidota bacterium]